MTNSPQNATKRIWITDGSLVPFNDVVRLPAKHRSVFGLKAAYKGLIDPAVPVGEGNVAPERADDVFVPEAEWCLLVPGGFTSFMKAPETLTLATPVLMQGMIEGKWINRLLGCRDWEPASIGNNLLATGSGISTSLGEIEAGTGGEVIVTYSSGHDDEMRERSHRTVLTDLMGQNVLNLVRAVLGHCRDHMLSLDAIDLSAMGEDAAVVNERWRVRSALRFNRIPVLNPANLFRPYDVGQRVLRRIIDDDIGVAPGTAITVHTTDGMGATVGQGQLLLCSGQHLP